MDITGIVAAWPSTRDKAAALSAAENDESEPYKTKYEAQRILTNYCAIAEVALAAGGETRTAVEDVLAQARLIRGVIHIQTEENSAGEASLLQGVEWVKERLLGELLGSADAPVVAIVEASCTAVEGCNYLALIYSGWDEPGRSLKYLRLAKAVFSAAARRLRSVSSDASDPSSPLSAAARTLDSLYTHVLFYYAQIYGKLGATAVAAGYIEQTLLRQLREGSRGVGLDRTEWARNAMRISEFHRSRPRGWGAAAMCLAAADVVVAHACAESPDGAPEAAAAGDAGWWRKLPEALQRLLAESAVHWAQIYVGVLGEARDERLVAAAGRAEEGAAAAATVSPAPPLGTVDCPPRAAIGGGVASPAETVDLDASDHEGGDDDASAGRHTLCCVASGDASDTAGSAGREGTTEAGLAAATEGDASSSGDEPRVAQAAVACAAAACAAPGAQQSDSRSALRGGERLPRGLPFADFVCSEVAALPRWVTTFAPAVLEPASLKPGEGVSAAAAAPAAAATSAGSDSVPPRTPSPGRSLCGLPAIPVPEAVRSFEAARDVFKAGLSACTRALEFFALEGFVTEHVEVHRLESRLYKNVRARAGGGGGARAGSLSPALLPLVCSWLPSSRT